MQNSRWWLRRHWNLQIAVDSSHGFKEHYKARIFLFFFLLKKKKRKHPKTCSSKIITWLETHGIASQLWWATCHYTNSHTLPNFLAVGWERTLRRCMEAKRPYSWSPFFTCLPSLAARLKSSIMEGFFFFFLFFVFLTNHFSDFTGGPTVRKRGEVETLKRPTDGKNGAR